MASGRVPLEAVTVNVDVPAAVGVPDNNPVVASRLIPAGREPDVTAKLGTGVPVATNV
jgi:hypothetical protein